MKETKTTGYFITFAILLGMAFVNIGVAQANVGGYNTAIILGVACVQAFVLAAYFMHLRESPRFLWVVVFSGFFFISILAVYVVADNHGRDTMPRPPQAWELPAKVTLPKVAAPAHSAHEAAGAEAHAGK